MTRKASTGLVLIAAVWLIACGGGDPAGTDDGADPMPDAGADTPPPPPSDPPPDDQPPEPVPPPDDDEPPAAACDGLPADTGDSVVTVSFGGRERSYRLHLPPSYDPSVPTPLVLNFHALGSSAGIQESYTQMSAKSDDEGFVVVHPQGIGGSWNGGACCGQAQASRSDDVGFVAAILDDLSDRVCVDSRRVYATGMSNGGFMSHRLACDLADRISAIAPVAGTNATLSCAPSRPVPVMHFHGTLDTIVPFAGTRRTIADWVERNGCDSEPRVTFDEGNATCETYGSCTDEADVTLCSIRGLAHLWPGGPGGLSSIDATDAIWEFFAAQPPR